MFLLTMEGFLNRYHEFIANIAHIVIYTLELTGILVIAIGSIKCIYDHFHCVRQKIDTNIKIALGNTLALGLEFKMGAEIIKTVIAKDINELIILGVIILLRAILAVLIHWEIKTEMKEEELEKIRKDEIRQMKEEKEREREKEIKTGL